MSNVITLNPKNAHHIVGDQIKLGVSDMVSVLGKFKPNDPVPVVATVVAALEVNLTGKEVYVLTTIDHRVQGLLEIPFPDDNLIYIVVRDERFESKKGVTSATRK